MSDWLKELETISKFHEESTPLTPYINILNIINPILVSIAR